ncbi:MAG: glycosyltransferase [bacterium]
MPKVSIITASYNYENFISEAIESVLSQTFKDWELIIVDDGSNDDSIEVIGQYVQKHPNISLFTHFNNENKGLNETIKLGLEKSSGEYIAFLESDDFWENNYLKTKIDIFAQNPEAKLVFNNINIFGCENETVNAKKRLINPVNAINQSYHWPKDLSHVFLVSTIIPTFSCVMVEKNALQECNFNLAFDAWLDSCLWAQIAFKHKLYYTDEKLTHWRIHSDSYTNSVINKKNKSKNINNFFCSLLELFKKTDLQKYTSTLFKACVYKMINCKVRQLESGKDNFIEAIKDKKVYLYGAGSFAEEVLEYCNALKLNIAGFIDGDKTKSQQNTGKYKIFCKDDIATLKPDVIIISVQNWESCYFELLTYLIEKDLKIMPVSNFFELLRYKTLLNEDNLELLNQENIESLEKLYFSI